MGFAKIKKNQIPKFDNPNPISNAEIQKQRFFKK